MHGMNASHDYDDKPSRFAESFASELQHLNGTSSIAEESMNEMPSFGENRPISACSVNSSISMRNKEKEDELWAQLERPGMYLFSSQIKYNCILQY